MVENLYRSYSLEKSDSEAGVLVSGSLTTWENSPESPLNVGDSFRPVPDGPLLTVKKVNISDNVIGIKDGKTFRQWQISIEGNNQDELVDDVETSVLYNFNFDADEHSGSMQVTNSGNAPALTLDIGDNFNVPGIGEIPCVSVEGSDAYDDYGNHIWTVTYKGSDASVTQSVTQETKYSLAIEKDSDGLLQKSGSMSVINSGESPSINVQVGSTFNIPGIGSVTCSKVTGSDDYTDAGVHRWTLTYEGYINDDSGSGDDPQSDTHDSKYNFTIERDTTGQLVRSGSVEITTITNTPPSTYEVGSTINLPGIGEVTCVKVSGSDSYTENGRRKWVMVYEASDNQSIANPEQQSSATKYSFDIENNSDGVTVYSGTKEVSYSGDSPNPGIALGDEFSLPVVGTLTCTKVRGSDEGNNSWTFTIEGSRTGSDSSGDDPQDASLPDDEVSVSYEINGSTVRTVDGEFIALRKSQTPITKKTFTVCSNSETLIATPGSTYQGGIAISESIIKETIKSNSVVTGSYYKHTIEVEA